MLDVLVLCYHAVSERWPAVLSVTPAQLQRQLGLLVGRGYRGATFHEAVTSPPAARTLAVTFDDAYLSVLDHAMPILSNLGLTGTVFVPTAFPDSNRPMSWDGIDEWIGGPHEHELTPMSWPQLKRLADAGWQIGSHSRTHRRLTELDDAALAEELQRSRVECEAGTGRPCRSIAYPYGDHDDRIVEAARDAGYATAATLPRRLDPPRSLRWPRVGIYHGDGRVRFRLKVSRAVRAVRTSLASRAAESKP